MHKVIGTEFRETGRKGLPKTPVIGTAQKWVGYIPPNMSPVQS